MTALYNLKQQLRLIEAIKCGQLKFKRRERADVESDLRDLGIEPFIFNNLVQSNLTEAGITNLELRIATLESR